jgi:hypothetical protein
MRIRSLTAAGVAAAALVTATASPAWADAGTTQVPESAQIASTGTVTGTPTPISTQEEIQRATAAGVPSSQLSAMASSPDSYSCYYWNTYRYYKNLAGLTILRFHVEPNWCTTGYWLADPVYTNTWADVNVPGWSYSHTGGWTKYGAGWNYYLTHQEGHFCFASYFGCVQNKYPWIEDYVGPGSATQYMHSAG